MKHKYFLIGAAVILFILIIITSFVRQASRKKNAYNQSNTKQIATTNNNPQFIPSPTPELLKGQKDYAAFQDFLNILSGPTQQNTESTPPSDITTPTSIPLTDEERAKKSEAKVLQNYKAFSDLLGIVFAQGNASQQQSSFYPDTILTTQISPSSTLQPQNQPSTFNPISSDFIYYSQCNGDYDNYPLPNGCNICKAGCGQTTVAMILSSYIDRQFTPSAVADSYKQNGFTAGCKGSTVGDAQQILQMNGLKTTDIIYYGDSSVGETTEDLKSYLKAGWTMYMLAKFCPKGCGHFFWIVDIDKDNNIWTYDPGYGNIDGKKIVPLNETTLNPAARYYVAFGVKK